MMTVKVAQLMCKASFKMEDFVTVEHKLLLCWADTAVCKYGGCKLIQCMVIILNEIAICWRIIVIMLWSIAHVACIARNCGHE